MTFDLASVCGVAYGLVTDRDPSFAAWRLARDQGEGMRYISFENELYAALEMFQPSKIILEAPISLQAAAKHGESAVRQAYALRGFVRAAADRYSAAFSEIDV